jgi:hypothetical protein
MDSLDCALDAYDFNNFVPVESCPSLKYNIERRLFQKIYFNELSPEAKTILRLIIISPPWFLQMVGTAKREKISKIKIYKFVSLRYGKGAKKIIKELEQFAQEIGK